MSNKLLPCDFIVGKKYRIKTRLGLETVAEYVRDSSFSYIFLCHQIGDLYIHLPKDIKDKWYEDEWRTAESVSELNTRPINDLQERNTELEKVIESMLTDYRIMLKRGDQKNACHYLGRHVADLENLTTKDQKE